MVDGVQRSSRTLTGSSQRACPPIVDGLGRNVQGLNGVGGINSTVVKIVRGSCEAILAFDRQEAKIRYLIQPTTYTVRYLGNFC